jgi:hypothetical protein
VASAWAPQAPVALAVDQAAPLVGRAAELDTLRGCLQAAWRGHGQTILLGGDSGVGKTRLAFEVLRAAEAGMTTLLGAAYEQEGQLAYQPFVEAFDRYLAEKRRPRGDHPITHFQRRSLSDEQQEQWALFNATAAFLSDLAAHMPAVLLLDDLHAADPASPQLFHYLARQTHATPIILLATYRSDLVDPTVASFSALLIALYRERLSETVHLLSLSEDAVGGVAAHTLGSAPAPDLVRAVYEITEGNPFYVADHRHRRPSFRTNSVSTSSVDGCAKLSSVSGRYCSCPLSMLAAPWPRGWRRCTASCLGLAILPQMIDDNLCVCAHTA